MPRTEDKNIKTSMYIYIAQKNPCRFHWLERRACNADNTGSNLVRHSYYMERPWRTIIIALQLLLHLQQCTFALWETLDQRQLYCIVVNDVADRNAIKTMSSNRWVCYPDSYWLCSNRSYSE